MKVIVIGASGMVGQGVLRECLLDKDVERVLVVGRRPPGRDAEDDRIEQAVRVVEHEHDRPTGRDQIRVLDDAHRVIEPHERFGQPVHEGHERAPHSTQHTPSRPRDRDVP